MITSNFTLQELQKINMKKTSKALEVDEPNTYYLQQCAGCLSPSAIINF